MAGSRRDRLPWFAWPLVPLVLPISLLVMLPLALLAVVTIPYFWLCPDRHAQLYDFEGTPHQRARLVCWRAAYRRLGLWGRLRRAVKLSRRCRRKRRSRNKGQSR